MTLNNIAIAYWACGILVATMADFSQNRTRLFERSMPDRVVTFCRVIVVWPAVVYHIIRHMRRRQ